MVRWNIFLYIRTYFYIGHCYIEKKPTTLKCWRLCYLNQNVNVQMQFSHSGVYFYTEFEIKLKVPPMRKVLEITVYYVQSTRVLMSNSWIPHRFYTKSIFVKDILSQYTHGVLLRRYQLAPLPITMFIRLITATRNKILCPLAHYAVDYNYLSLSLIPASGTQVLMRTCVPKACMKARNKWI